MSQTYTQEQLDAAVAAARHVGWQEGRDFAYGQRMLAPERTEFMRRAVIELYAGGVRGVPECWALAKALWDAEPGEH